MWNCQLIENSMHRSFRSISLTTPPGGIWKFSICVLVVPWMLREIPVFWGTEVDDWFGFPVVSGWKSLPVAILLVADRVSGEAMLRLGLRFGVCGGSEWPRSLERRCWTASATVFLYWKTAGQGGKVIFVLGGGGGYLIWESAGLLYVVLQRFEPPERKETWPSDFCWTEAGKLEVFRMYVWHLCTDPLVNFILGNEGSRSLSKPAYFDTATLVKLFPCTSFWNQNWSSGLGFSFGWWNNLLQPSQPCCALETIKSKKLHTSWPTISMESFVITCMLDETVVFLSTLSGV